MPITIIPAEDFAATAAAYKNKLLTVAGSATSPYLTKLKALLWSMLEKGASIEETKTAIRRLNNAQVSTPAEPEQTAHPPATEKR
jgi:hypothetical protein